MPKSALVLFGFVVLWEGQENATAAEAAQTQLPLLPCRLDTQIKNLIYASWEVSMVRA